MEKFPGGGPTARWAAQAWGILCTICEEPITNAELELEVQFAPSDGRGEPERHHLHIRCFAAWEFERTKV